MPTAVQKIDTLTESGDKPPAKSTRDFKSVRVVHEGERIIIPEGMSYGDACNWILRQQEAEEKLVAIADKFPCYPLDGVIALMVAMRQVYGFASLQDTPGFFGPTPPRLIQVPLANGGFETAPLGRIAIPKWEGGYIETIVTPQPVLIIGGQIKRKFEPEVKRLLTLAREISNECSIYKGQAVRVDLKFMRRDEEHPFDPLDDAPKFIDTDSIADDALILNETTDFELRANIFTLIERTDACRKHGIPLKHGALLMGTYGTGKTLTAGTIAKKCVRNGWTFLYLKSAQDLAHALRLAELYSPAVVFAEDIDQAVSGNRDAYLNELLNTMDGVDTKGKPIITILTTNNPESISPAFLRAGRIDTIIQMTAPDEKTSTRFVVRFARDDDGKSVLAPGTDLTQAGKELAGFVPAFIAEAVQKAKRFCLYREGEDITGKLTGEDIAAAARALKQHIAMVNKPQVPTDAEIVAKAVGTIGSWITDGEVPR